MREKRSTTLAALCAMASAASAASTMMFGYVNVDIPASGGANLVGYAFSNGTAQTLEEALANAALLESTDPAQADLVYAWDDAAESYVACFRKPDGFFYLRDTPATRATGITVSEGDALFLKSPASAASAHAVALAGAVSIANEQARGLDGQTAIANPYPCALALNDLDWSAATAGDLPTLADQIHIWSPTKSGGPGFENYFLKSAGGTNAWYSGEAPFAEADPVLPAGGGALYQAVTPFTNSIVRPFSL